MSQPSREQVLSNLNDKTILITGGTGTFGKACIKYLRGLNSRIKIRVFSRDEFKQSTLREQWGSKDISYMLGDVRNIERLRLAFRNVDIVIHAAALKHVSLGEYNPREFIETNIMGTENVCRAAIDAMVPQVITLVSDKGVNPVNLYGATKMVAEKSTIQYNSYSPGVGTSFKVVRYGNVAGSRGSAIGLFKRCMAQGKKLPITDCGMTRFWMLISEAVDLVMYAIISPHRGAIFIPHLYSFHLMDLANAMIGRLDGAYTVTGIRPGEKLHESLMTEYERTCAYFDDFTIHGEKPLKGVYVLPPSTHDWNHTPICKSLQKATPALCHDYTSLSWPWCKSVAELREDIASHVIEAE